ncbi:MAG: diphosphate--fructose-6-phosphate 1-phosphotransferase [Spirochaetaceae bacterium]
MKGNAIIGQSGGPTAVINASLAGAIAAATGSARIGRIYGMRYGIRGLLDDHIIDLSSLGADRLARLARTPSSALGSTRYKLADDDLPAVLEALRARDIRYFFLIGGNDTMDTIHRVEAYCREDGYELRGVGIPKTVDNDLYGTDHTPGFPSAARDIALSVQQAARLARDMQKVDQYAVFQAVGRDAGWLAAAAGLAKRSDADGPHLVYIPEVPISPEGFLADVTRCVEDYGYAYVVCGEGVLWEDGTPVSASRTTDAFANIEFGAMGGSSAALNLHRLIAEHTGYRGEFQITESLPMCAADRVSEVDRREAYDCGGEAVRIATGGASGVMVTIERTGEAPYESAFGTADLSTVARRTHRMPDAFYDPAGRLPTDAFRAYAAPLVGELPAYETLDDLQREHRRSR